MSFVYSSTKSIFSSACSLHKKFVEDQSIHKAIDLSKNTLTKETIKKIIRSLPQIFCIHFKIQLSRLKSIKITVLKGIINAGIQDTFQKEIPPYRGSLTNCFICNSKNKLLRFIFIRINKNDVPHKIEKLFDKVIYEIRNEDEEAVERSDKKMNKDKKCPVTRCIAI